MRRAGVLVGLGLVTAGLACAPHDTELRVEPSPEFDAFGQEPPPPEPPMKIGPIVELPSYVSAPADRISLTIDGWDLYTVNRTGEAITLVDGDPWSLHVDVLEREGWVQGWRFKVHPGCGGPPRVETEVPAEHYLRSPVELPERGPLRLIRVRLELGDGAHGVSPPLLSPVFAYGEEIPEE